MTKHTSEKTNIPLVIHVSKHFYPVFGGLERMITGIIKNTSSHIQHEVLCYNTDLADHQNSLPAHEIYDEIPIRRIKFKKFGWFHFGFYPISLLKKADIIHVHNTDLLLDYIVFLKFIFRFRAKILVSTHGMIFHHQKMLFLKNLYMISGFAFKRHFVDKILATGMSDFIYFRNYLNIRDISIIENQVNIFPDSKNKTDSKSGLITINRLQNSKNLNKLISVCVEMRKLGFSETITLILSGDEKEFDDVKNSISRQIPDIRLKFNCSDDEKWSLLGQAKTFVSLSEYEGFGIAILEALLKSCHVFVYQTVSINFDHHHFENLHSLESELTTHEIAQFVMNHSVQTPIPIKNEMIELFNWSQKSKEMIAIYRHLIEPNHH